MYFSLPSWVYRTLIAHVRLLLVEFDITNYGTTCERHPEANRVPLSKPKDTLTDMAVGSSLNQIDLYGGTEMLHRKDG